MGFVLEVSEELYTDLVEGIVHDVHGECRKKCLGVRKGDIISISCGLDKTSVMFRVKYISVSQTVTYRSYYLRLSLDRL